MTRPSATTIDRLVTAAWAGIEQELEKEDASASEVLNAALSMAAGAIAYACVEREDRDRERVAANRLNIRTALQRLILDHTMNLDQQVM